MKKFNHLHVPDQWNNYFTRYPQGYTILESLLNWVTQVDNMVDNQNELNTKVSNFRKEIDDFVDRFDPRLQEEVIKTLSEWQDSGFLDVVIDEALHTQMDELQERAEQTYINVKHRGAMGDGVTDDTIVFKQSIAEAIDSGTNVFIPQGEYVIKDTLIIGDNTDYGNPAERLQIIGNHMRNTKLLFEPEQDGIPLFYFSANAGYTVLQDMELKDVHTRTNVGIRMQDWLDNAGNSNWKNHFERVHVADFDIGLELLGGEQTNHAGDTHLDGITLEKVAFWNYNKGIVVNNIQAVQMQGLDVDFISTFEGNENSTALWLNVGTTFNFIGGSWIGRGQFIRINASSHYYAANYHLDDIRFEFRNGNTRPIIEYSDNSQGYPRWSTSTQLSLTLDNCIGIGYNQDIVLIKTPVHGDVLFNKCFWTAGNYEANVYQTTETMVDTSTTKGSRGKLAFDGNTPIKINLIRDTTKYIESDKIPHVIVRNEYHGTASSDTKVDTQGYLYSETKDMTLARHGGLVHTERKMLGIRTNNTRLSNEIKLRLPEHAIPLNLVFPRTMGFLSKHGVEVYLVKDNDRWLNTSQFNIDEDAIQLFSKNIPTDIGNGNLVMPISSPNAQSFIGNGFVLKTNPMESSIWKEGRLLIRFIDTETGELVTSGIPPIEYLFVEYI